MRSVLHDGMLTLARRDADGEVHYGFDAESLPLLEGMLRARGVLAWTRRRAKVEGMVRDYRVIRHAPGQRRIP